MSIRIKLGLIFLLTALTLFAIALGGAKIYTDYAFKHELIKERTHQILNTTLAVQVHFAKQVQEWKNILLRGADPEAYNKYLQQFFIEELTTRENIDALLQLLEEHPKQRDIAQIFRNAHITLGALYRQALPILNRNGQHDLFAADRYVEDISRKPMELLDRLLQSTVTLENEALTQLDTQTTRVQITVIVSVAALFTFAVLLFIWIVDRLVGRPVQRATLVASRISEGDLSTNITARGADEIGQLFRALRKMQNALTRTRDIEQSAQQELIKARDNAITAAKRKSNFLANVSHEIRSPLMAIQGSLGLLSRSRIIPIPKEAASLLELADRNTAQLLRFLDDILDFSRLEAGELRIASTCFACHDVIERTIKRYTGKATAKGLNLVNATDPALDSRVEGDPERVEQVLQALLLNALEHTPSGRIVIDTLPTIDEKTGENYLRIEVMDTGKGIAPQEQARVLDIFRHDDPYRAHPGRSSGLSLAISRRLIEAMGGEFGLESKVGQGSTFWFTLKRFCVPENATDAGPDPALEKNAPLDH